MVIPNFYGLGPCNFYPLTSTIENKKQKQALLEILMKSLLVSHKDLYWAHCFLILCDLLYDIDDLDMASYTDDNKP